MKKKITIKELKSLIKEEASKLQRRTLLENEKKALQEELGSLGDESKQRSLEWDKLSPEEQEKIDKHHEDLRNKESDKEQAKDKRNAQKMRDEFGTDYSLAREGTLSEYDDYNEWDRQELNVDRAGREIEIEREWTDMDLFIGSAGDQKSVIIKKDVKINGKPIEAGSYLSNVIIPADTKKYMDDNDISMDSFVPSKQVVVLTHRKLGVKVYLKYEDFYEFTSKNENSIVTIKDINDGGPEYSY